jgi:hypothetical protein
MSYYNLCGIGSQHSNISKGKGGVNINPLLYFVQKTILNLVPNWYPIIFTCPFRSDSCSYVSNIDISVHYMGRHYISGLDINVCPIPVKTDVGQVDLVLRLSDGTSEKDNFYVSVPEWFLFLCFKYWYFRSLKRFWDCDFNFVNVLELHHSMENDKWYNKKSFDLAFHFSLSQIPKRAGTTDKSISIGIKYWVCCIKEPCLISNLFIIYFY